MPRLDFHDDHTAAIRRFNKQIQFTSSDNDVAGKNAMPATPKPTGGDPLSSTPCSS